MKLINSKVEIITQSDNTIEGIYKQIEIAGRTCYKSEDKITPTSAKEFVDRMIKSGHGAMLEHGTVYLKFCINDPNHTGLEVYHRRRAKFDRLLDKYTINKYSIAKVNKYNDTIFITTNYRVLVENDWLDDLKYLCDPTESHEKRISVRWTCDRGVSHEFVRHRVFSFAQESTRYCNYSKDKFNNELTFIIPTWLALPEGNYTYWDGDWVDIDKQVIQVSENDINTHSFLNTLECSEYQYTMLINAGWKPQQARQILPNALKTELVMTGFESDWKHFFELRCDTAAHPDARKLALELYKLIYNKEYGKE